MKEFVIGSRGSQLALWQARWIAARLEEAGHAPRIEIIKTTGDIIRDVPLAQVGVQADAKGVFTKEIEEALLDGRIDLAVHSLKDLPVTLPDGLTVAAFPERADPRDALVSAAATSLGELPPGAVVLTGSLRRRAQVLALRPDLEVRPVRGNVDTRLAKRRSLEEQEGRPGGAILAMAGLGRLGVTGEPVHPIDPGDLLPAPGQGILAIEVRAGSQAEAACRELDHGPSARAAEAERGVVTAFGGDCTLPLAAWAREEPADGGARPRLRLSALLATPDGARRARGEAVAESPEEAAARCVEAMREDGADEVLALLADGEG